MSAKCRLARAIVRISEAQRRDDERWRAALEAPGVNWQKVVCYTTMAPVFLILIGPVMIMEAFERLGKWARKKAAECPE